MTGVRSQNNRIDVDSLCCLDFRESSIQLIIHCRLTTVNKRLSGENEGYGSVVNMEVFFYDAPNAGLDALPAG